jgi:hypothetical protein
MPPKIKIVHWSTLYYSFLKIAANEHYAEWKKGKNIRNRDNPYKRGYSQPDWIRDMVKAIGDGDEEKVKYIFMVESEYNPKLLEYRKQAYGLS